MTTIAHGQTGLQPLSDANRLGLDFAAEAAAFRYTGPVIDIHTHVSSPEGGELFLDAAHRYGVVKTFTMTGLDSARELHQHYPDDFEFICVPDYRRYMQSKDPNVFVDQWLDDIRGFREELGARVIKFWAAPRGRDFIEMAPDAADLIQDPRIGNPMLLDSPIRQRGLELALDLGYRVIMTHIGDPDTWFATKYADADRYGTKPQQYDPLHRLLRDHADITVIGAHMGGYPEDLAFVQAMLDEHDNYVVDTSATKWQVRELSRHPQALADFCAANPGRVLFGTDIVANAENAVPHEGNPDDAPGIGAGHGFELYASRFWALRTLLETDYDGPSPIVDPDLHMVDPKVPEKSTATLRGAALPDEVLRDVYYGAAARVIETLGGLT